MAGTRITRRLFNMWAGTIALGRYLIPSTAIEPGVMPQVDVEADEPEDAAEVKYRWLLTMPDRYQWPCKLINHKGEPLLDEEGTQRTETRTSYLWTEVVERQTIEDDDEVRVMVWTPVSDEEVAEAERFYAATEQIDFDDPGIHTVGFGPERTPRTKHAPATLDTDLPESDFVWLEKVEFSGVAQGVAAWAAVSGRADEILPNTLSAEPEQVVLEMLVLIQNRGATDLGIDAESLTLTTTKGESLPVYPGEPTDDMFFPFVIELDGEDSSPEHRTKIALSPGESCALEISFPMPNRLREAVAVKLCESITIPIAAGECECVVLDKK